jgi:hypothetical protein
MIRKPLLPIFSHFFTGKNLELLCSQISIKCCVCAPYIMSPMLHEKRNKCQVILTVRWEVYQLSHRVLYGENLFIIHISKDRPQTEDYSRLKFLITRKASRIKREKIVMVCINVLEWNCVWLFFLFLMVVTSTCKCYLLHSRVKIPCLINFCLRTISVRFEAEWDL